MGQLLTESSTIRSLAVLSVAVLGITTQSVIAQPAFAWAKSAGGTNHDWASSVAVDTLGNCFITGESQSTNVAFGGTTLTNPAGRGILVAKYDEYGSLLWARNGGQIIPGPSPFTRGLGIAVDGSANCYVAGVYSGTIAFGQSNLTSSGFSDLFLTKFSSNGNLAWAQKGGGTNGSDEVWGFRTVVHTNGSVYVAGQYSGTNLQFTSAAGTNLTLSGIGTFLARYDASGNLLWARTITGPGGAGEEIYPASLVADALGNLSLAGDFSSSTVSFGGITLTNAGDLNGFVASFDAQGNVQWARRFGGSFEDWPEGLTTDSAGNSYLTCNIFSTDATVNGQALTNGSQMLLKFGPAGNLTWAKSTPLLGKLRFDGQAHLLMTGDFTGTNIFGISTLTNSGDNFDVFLSQFDLDGNPVWAKQAGGLDLDRAWDVAISPAGDVLLTGEFQSTARFDGLQLTNNFSEGDLFVTRISGPPRLNLELLFSQVRLTWPASALGYGLQSTTNLTVAQWSPVTNVPLVVGTNFQVTLNLQNNSALFRLRNP